MIYDKSHKNDSPYRSVNELIKPQKYSGNNAFSHQVNQEQERPSWSIPPLSAKVSQYSLSNLNSGLRISRPDDPAEREADKLAQQVVGTTPSQSNLNPLQRKTSMDAGVNIESNIDAVISSSGQPLPDPTKKFFESKMGQDFSNVRIHNDQKANESAMTIHAKAYTVGNDITFSKNEYQPGTNEGQLLIAHELAHVSQQKDNIIHRAITPEELNVEMIGKKFYLTTDFKSSQTVYNKDTVLIITEWENSKSVVKGRCIVPSNHTTQPEIEIPKLYIRPYLQDVEEIYSYHTGIEGQIETLEQGNRRIEQLKNKKAEYEKYNNLAGYYKELQRLMDLQRTRENILNRMLIQETMYNLFDESIKKWTDYYNQQFKDKFPKDPLDPNLVKSMIFQESEMGTVGEHMNKTISSTALLLKTRFNVMQMIDSASLAFLIIFDEMKPDLIIKYKLNQLKIDLEKAKQERKQLLTQQKQGTLSNIDKAKLDELNEQSQEGRNWSTYMWQWNSSALLDAVFELMKFLNGSPILDYPKQLEEGKPFGYNFWIRMGIRWLFYKRLNEATISWEEAIRAYNGSGADARAYKKNVTERAKKAKMTSTEGDDFVPKRSY